MLLFLIPPSCMVVPNRELANKFFFSSSNIQSSQTLPTVYQDINIEIDILKGYSPDNYNKVRGRMLSYNSNISNLWHTMKEWSIIMP